MTAHMPNNSGNEHAPYEKHGSEVATGPRTVSMGFVGPVPAAFKSTPIPWHVKTGEENVLIEVRAMIQQGESVKAKILHGVGGVFTSLGEITVTKTAESHPFSQAMSNNDELAIEFLEPKEYPEGFAATFVVGTPSG